MLKHALRASSVSERTLRSYNFTIMAPKKAKDEKKLLDTPERKYSTKMELLLHLINISEPLFEYQMVETLLDQIKSSNTYLKTEVTICRSSHSSTFSKATTYLSTVVSRLYPSTNPS